MPGNTELVLVDTSVWIDALRGETPIVVKVTQGLLKDDRAVTCGPVLFELKRGLRISERKKILPLFDALVRLSFKENDWDAAGDLDASLRKKGITLPPMDIIIARACLHHKVSLFTLDKHFSSVHGLQLFEP